MSKMYEAIQFNGGVLWNAAVYPEADSL
jgi:hypothetical protein